MSRAKDLFTGFSVSGLSSAHLFPMMRWNCTLKFLLDPLKKQTNKSQRALSLFFNSKNHNLELVSYLMQTLLKLYEFNCAKPDAVTRIQFPVLCQHTISSSAVNYLRRPLLAA